MSNNNKSYRIKANVNSDEQYINIDFSQEFDKFEILSLTINQTNAYKLENSDTGIIAGRILANEGFGIPNAKISVFIKYNSNLDIDSVLQYQYSSTSTKDDNGVRYNLLPNASNDECHQDVGTFPTKRYLLDNNDVIEVFDNYYKYTTRSNNSGDYMLYGVPTGQQTIHCDVDLSDVGILSQTPRDMIGQGYSKNMFESASKFKYSTDIDSLHQIVTDNKSIYVYPFWGDTTDSDINAAVTRCDINIPYKFESYCVFIGSAITDTGNNAVSKKCVPSKEGGKMSEMTTSSGTIEMIRKTENGDIEQFSVNGNEVIDDNGVWCYQIPMNLDYVMTDEYGNTVISDNPNKGIPTRASVRFRVSLHENPADGVARKRARFLVPNNPMLVSDNYPKFSETNTVDYEFGTKTLDEDFRDLMWNNVYTVKSYIPRIQKSRLPNNLKHLGIKMVNHSGSNNPMPYNKLSIKFNFMYTFLCVLIKVLIQLTRFANIIIYGINSALLGIAHSMIAISNRSFWKKNMTFLAGIGGMTPDQGKTSNVPFAWVFPNSNTNNRYVGCDNVTQITIDNLNDNRGNDNNKANRAAWCGVAYFLKIICDTCIENDLNKWAFGDIMNKANIQGLAAVLCCLVNAIGRGITLDGLCDDENGNSISITPGPNTDKSDFLQFIMPNVSSVKCYDTNNDIASLYNCVENQLAQENEVTSFNFYNDWVNGVLYFPLWYRKIKAKKKFLFIKLKGKDQWCNGDIIARGSQKNNLKVYNNCTIKRTVTSNSLSPLNDDYSTVDVTNSKANDETGREDMNFKVVSEDNCYGYQCHKNGRTETPIINGFIIEKETMLGDKVYYYKPTYISKYEDDLVTLFATDIVLLGSLKSCDLHGIPQFFKILEGTSYQMPPNLLNEDYEYKTLSTTDSDDNTDENDNNLIDSSTRHTEYTGADWGNLGVDQSNYMLKTMYTTYEANENIYDNGGLFYGLTCFDSYTKPKSIINLERICEIGVSLDESQDILKSKLIFDNPGSVKEYDDSKYTVLTPDGYISYDDIYNPDYRSMFATLNSNFLKTKRNYDTGLVEYDLTHQYLDNFDGSLAKIMAGGATHGNIITDGVDTNMKANYANNYKLEVLDQNYLMFRYGGYTKQNGKKCYYYQYDKVMSKVKVDGIRYSIMSGSKFPRYENSFYFYFGLKEGSTAIDKFYSDYYASCTENTNYGKSIDYDFVGNDWCSGTGGYIKFDTAIDLPITLTLTNKDNETITYTWENIGVNKFYVGTNINLANYTYIEFEDSLDDHIESGNYTITIVDGNGEEYTDSISFYNENRITFTAEKFDFNVTNDNLKEIYGNSGENVKIYITDSDDNIVLTTYSSVIQYGYINNNDFIIACTVTSSGTEYELNYSEFNPNNLTVKYTDGSTTTVIPVEPFTKEYYMVNDIIAAQTTPTIDDEGNIIGEVSYTTGYSNLNITDELTVTFYNTVADDGNILDGVLSRPYYGYIKISDINFSNFSIVIKPSVDGALDGFSGAKYTVFNSDVASEGHGYIGYSTSDSSYYFGVPYGNVSYDITVTMLCDNGDGTYTDSTNETSMSITVYEGVFRMFVNNVDYDIIKKFSTGWINVSSISLSKSKFNSSYVKGWDDLDNIGIKDYLNIYPISPEIVADASAESGYSLNNQTDIDNLFGMLCKTPTYNDSQYQPVKNCYYNWFDSNVIDEDTWNELTYGFELIEDEEGRSPGEEGYIITITGDVVTKCNMLNEVIENRIETSREVIGAFRVDSSGSLEIYISYQSKSTPIKYCIVNGMTKAVNNN